MSRNLRRRHPAKPKKATRQRSPTPSVDLSGEEGYSAVEDISDAADDEESDVEAAESEHIIKHELRTGSSASTRPESTDEEDDDEVDDDDDEASVEGHDEIDGHDGWNGIVSDSDQEDLASQGTATATATAASTPVERHVRFNVPDSESDSTETDEEVFNDLFPDIFVSKNILDPGFRREIDLDRREVEPTWDEVLYYDRHEYVSFKENDASESEGEAPTATNFDDVATWGTDHLIKSSPAKAVSGADYDDDISGYGSDGDTTEEDIPDPPVRRKTRRVSFTEESSDSDTVKRIKSQRGEPRAGRFDLDRSVRKPIVVVNSQTRKLMIFTAHRRQQLDLSPEQFKFPFFDPFEAQPVNTLSSTGNAMLSAMVSSSSFPDNIPGETWPAEAFFPQQPGNLGESAAALLDGVEDGDESVDLDAYFVFESVDGEDPDSEMTEASATEGAGESNDSGEESPRCERRDASEATMHEYITSDRVGAFRRNQQERKLSASGADDDASVQSSLRAIKDNCLGSASTPLSPARRSRKEFDDFMRSSPLDKASQKRKASDEGPPSHHKRQMSISDFSTIQI